VALARERQVADDAMSLSFDDDTLAAAFHYAFI
jgi:hypothetical protein